MRLLMVNTAKDGVSSIKINQFANGTGPIPLRGFSLKGTRTMPQSDNPFACFLRCIYHFMFLLFSGLVVSWAAEDAFVNLIYF
jgi:hypothetical protein